MTVNERLPTELGWTTKTEVVTLEDITRVSDLIRNATSLFTDAAPASEAAQRRDLHAGGHVLRRSVSHSRFIKPLP